MPFIGDCRCFVVDIVSTLSMLGLLFQMFTRYLAFIRKLKPILHSLCFEPHLTVCTAHKQTVCGNLLFSIDVPTSAFPVKCVPSTKTSCWF